MNALAWFLLQPINVSFSYTWKFPDSHPKSSICRNPYGVMGQVLGFSDLQLFLSVLGLKLHFNVHKSTGSWWYKTNRPPSSPSVFKILLAICLFTIPDALHKHFNRSSVEIFISITLINKTMRRSDIFKFFMPLFVKTFIFLTYLNLFLNYFGFWCSSKSNLFSFFTVH